MKYAKKILAMAMTAIMALSMTTVVGAESEDDEFEMPEIEIIYRRDVSAEPTQTPDDDEKPLPSPRGWNMVDTILASEPMLRPFFTDKENDPKVVEKDMKHLVSAKLGASVATMFFASLVAQTRALMPEEIFADDEHLTRSSDLLDKMSAGKRVQTCDLMLNYLKENIEFMMLDKAGFARAKKQLSVLVKKLDSSSRLLFAQNLSSATTEDGNSLITMLFDVFEQDLIEMLDLSDATRAAIEGSK